MKNAQSIKDITFKLTLSKYDVLEGFFASYFALLATYNILFIENTFRAETLNVFFYIILQFSFVAFIVFCLLLFFDKKGKHLEVTQFFAIIFVPYINLLYIYAIVFSPQYQIFNLFNLFFGLLVLILFIKSISVVFYYFIFYYEMFVKKSLSSSNTFFVSSHLKKVGVSTQKEKNIFIIISFFFLGNLIYFNNSNTFLAPSQTFLLLFVIFEIWINIKKYILKITNK